MLRFPHALGLVLVSLLFFTLFAFGRAWAQGSGGGGGNQHWTDQPLPPEVSLLTVEPNTGRTTLSWAAPALSPNNPEPVGYIVYRGVLENGNWIWKPVADLPPSQFSWTDDEADARQGIVRYVMASKGPDETKPSKLTDPHATIFLKVEYVPCRNLIRMTWTPYVGWNNDIENYVVRAGDSQTWTSIPEFVTLPGAQWEHEFPSGQDKTWFIFLEARQKGTKQVTRSNLLKVETRKQYIPASILLDSIVSAPRHNRLTLKMKLNTDPAYFRLVRQNVFDEGEGQLESIDILRFTDPNTRELIDSVNPDQIQGRKRFYSIVAMDECDEEVDRSQKSNSIIARISTRGNKNQISWDKLEVSEGSRAEYRVHRIITKSTGMEELEIATVQHEPLQTVDDLAEFASQGVQNNFCYRVTAYEITTDNSTKRVSISAPQCAQIESQIEIPTAISPTESAATGNRLARNVFAPLSTYNAQYTMYIYNRSGETIFTGVNEGWNGRLRDGSYAPEGAYIYRIEFTMKERGSQVRTGSFMVVYPTR